MGKLLSDRICRLTTQMAVMDYGTDGGRDESHGQVCSHEQCLVLLQYRLRQNRALISVPAQNLRQCISDIVPICRSVILSSPLLLRLREFSQNAAHW